MKDHVRSRPSGFGGVFIIWGGNKPLANAIQKQLRDRLPKHASIISIGGGTLDDRRFLSLGEEIFDHLKSAYIAIVLAECDGSNGIRPNVLLEWGYVLRQLSPKRILACYINSNDDEVPSDVKGFTCVASEKSNYTPAKDLARKLCDKLEPILQELLAPDAPTEVEVMANWQEARSTIVAAAQGNYRYSRDYISNLLVRCIVPCAYARDHQLFNLVIDKNSQFDRTPDFKLFHACSRYYIESIEKRGSIRLDELDAHKTRIEDCLDLETNEFHRCIAFNFLGVIARKMAHQCRDDTKWLTLSRDALAKAMEIVDAPDHKDHDRSLFWRAYIIRNTLRTRRVVDGQTPKSMAESSITSRELLARKIVSITQTPSMDATSNGLLFELACEHLQAICDALDGCEDIVGRDQLALLYSQLSTHVARACVPMARNVGHPQYNKLIGLFADREKILFNSVSNVLPNS